MSLVAIFSSADKASAKAPSALRELRREGKLVSAQQLECDLQVHSAIHRICHDHHEL